MELIYSKESFPQTLSKSIFLAGPTPRKDLSLSWREECVEVFKELNYDGTLFLPINRDHIPFNPDTLEEQIDWEIKSLNACDCILFWIPRLMREDYEMMGLTTNVEFGRYLNSYKLIIGGNDTKNFYLQYISKDKYKWHYDMKDLVKDAIDFVGNPVERHGVECKIPKHIFTSKQFMNWYNGMKSAGNRLEDISIDYEFHGKKTNNLYIAIWHPHVYVEESKDGIKEQRIKSNEIVVGRPDMSYICAYYIDEHGGIWVIVCEEFRSAVNNSAGMVFELPGGSSLKEGEDELETASHELEEETGLRIESSRFKRVAMKQSAATLASHKICLFSVRLNSDEFEQVKNDTNSHGISEDSELIHIHLIQPLEEQYYEYMDWTTIGMLEQCMSKIILESVGK